MNEAENIILSLEHAMQHVQNLKKKNLKNCKMMFRLSEEQLKSIVAAIRSRLSAANVIKKKSKSKSSTKV